MSDDTKPVEGDDPFSDPGSASTFPAMKQLRGRTLIIRPTKLETGLPNTLQPGTTYDRMTADVIVLDGEPIEGRLDDDDNLTPFDEPLVAPFKLESMYISGAKLITECKGKLPRGEQPAGLVIGELTKLPPQKAGRKGAWSLKTATDEQKALGKQYLAKLDPFA